MSTPKPHAAKQQVSAGFADVAVGYFPEAALSLRRQKLYADGFLSVARKGHPRGWPF